MAVKSERPASALSSAFDDTDISDDLDISGKDEDTLNSVKPEEIPVCVNLAEPVTPILRQKSSGFFIADILSDRYAGSKTHAFVRPWDLPESQRTTTIIRKNGSHKTEKDTKRPKNSPLDALFKMASKTFEGLERPETRAGATSPHSHSPNSSANNNSKKKRKSRTAFTNHQVFELEKRFIYQKYLSPADRDEIAQSLGLSNAQVITWFQNRRAKLKRDIEELKKDVTATRLHSLQKSMYDNVRDVALLRAKYLDVKRVN